MNVTKEIFISHSSKDTEIVGYFIDDILIGVLGFHHSKIFCTSKDGMKIESGEDWREEIKENIKNAKITFLIITPNYKSSEICLNEMGAAWVSNGKVIPLIIEPINYESVGILQETKQIEKLSKESSLDRIKDSIESIFGSSLPKSKSDRWTSKKREFLSKVKNHLKDNPFSSPITADAVNKLQMDFENLNNDYDELVKEKLALEKVIKDMERVNNEQNVIKLKVKHGLISGLDEFHKINKQVLYSLKKINSTIVTIVFNEYTRNELHIDYNFSSKYLEEAKARRYLDSDLNVLWRETTEMMEIEEALNELKNYLKSLDDSTFEAIEEEYPSVPIDINNLTFWEEIIGIKLNYEL